MSVGTIVAKKRAEKSEGEARRFGSMTRMADDVLDIARVLAPMKGMGMAELMSDTLRPILSKMLDDEMRKRLGKK